MSFYVCVNGIFNKVHLKDIEVESPRLEKTHVPGLLYTKPLIKDHRHFVIDIMSSNVLYVENRSNVATAKAMMIKNQIHHLPVVDRYGKLCGVLSDRNILKLEKEFLGEQFSIQKVMNKTILCCDLDTDINSVARAFLKEMISCMPVIDELNHIIGIVTINDILKWVAGNKYQHN